MSRLVELLKKEFITIEELEEIEENEKVIEVENCGMSGQYVGHHWYLVKISNEDVEYSVYTK